MEIKREGDWNIKPMNLVMDVNIGVYKNIERFIHITYMSHIYYNV